MSDIGSKLVVVSGPAGVGKDTVVAKLLEKDNSFSLSVSATTNPLALSALDQLPNLKFTQAHSTRILSYKCNIHILHGLGPDIFGWLFFSILYLLSLLK